MQTKKSRSAGFTPAPKHYNPNVSTDGEDFLVRGFTMIVLLVSVVIVILLSLYAYSRTMKRVEKDIKENAPEGMDIPAPTIQNHQKVLDSVKQNIKDSMQKEQDRIDDMQE